MNRNNNIENHEIAFCQHLNGRFAYSSVLFRLTYLLLLRYYISGKTMFIEVKLLLFYYVINRNWTTSRGTQRGYSSKPLNIALLNVF